MSGETWQLGPLRVQPGQTLRGVFKVDVGLTQIDFPLALINGIEPDPVVLVTAGMDGDEYAASEAALRLIDALDPTELRGRVMVCPVLDPLSFEALHSQNPLDGLFLRHLLPGDIEGKPTQRLAHFLYHNFVLPADVWVALEAPDLGEGAIPFAFTYQGDDSEVNEQNRLALRNSGATTGLLHPPGEWPPALHSMVANTTLVVSCAGQRHRVAEPDVNAHLGVIRSILHSMDMAGLSEPPAAPATYLEAEPLLAQASGLWYPRIQPGDTVEVGQVVGEIHRMDGSAVLQEVTSSVAGVALSVRTGLAARARLRVALIAHRPQQSPARDV